MISEFQVAMIAIVVAILLAVIIYNRWQERNARKRAESVFGSHHGDALLDVPTKSLADNARSERREPLLSAMPDYDDLELELDEGRATPTVAEPTVLHETAQGIHVGIDSVALVLADHPVTPEQYLIEVSATSHLGKPVIWEGLNGGLWQPIDAHGDEHYRELRAGLQLANRQGPVDQTTIVHFHQLVQTFAANIGAVLQCEDVTLAESRATALDDFCAQTDVEVVIHVMGLNGVTFAPTKVRGQAEARGLKPLATGEYAFCNDLGAVLFTLRNMDASQPPGITRGASYFTGISFALDVPRTPDCVATFERMFSTALVFADILQGEVVDDNKKTLTASTKKIIAESVSRIAAEMQAKGIEPGSPAALRLYN